VCSTDSEELAQMSTRVLVLDRGRIAHRLHAPVDGDTITAACLTTTTRASAS
jgi:ABC-type sugar transport system ATPase subunit